MKLNIHRGIYQYKNPLQAKILYVSLAAGVYVCAYMCMGVCLMEKAMLCGVTNASF